MKKKYLSYFSFLLVLFCFINFAYAGDLKISNDSKYGIDMKVNNGECDWRFTMQPRTIDVLPERLLAQLCVTNRDKCVIKLYTTPFCSENSYIGQIRLSVADGVFELMPNHFTFGSNGFNLFLKGPWV